MAGRHAAASSGKKPLIIVIISVLAAALIGGGIFFFMNMNSKSDNKKPVETTTPETQTQQTTVADTTGSQSSAKAAQAQTQAPKKPIEDTENTATTSAADIVVPTQAGQEVSYFNATYIPNGEAKDIESGNSVSLREVLGAGYTEGALTFNSDGTFTDTLSAASPDTTGKYVVQGDKITATYASDKNMEITVTSWDNGEPSQFYINYGGCYVYFG